MLYETSVKKPGASPGKTAVRPATQVVKKLPVNAASKKPQSVAGIQATKPAPTKKPVVKGWPSQQKSSAKPHAATISGHPQQKQVTHKTTPRLSHPHTTVKGWPSHQKGVLKPHGTPGAKYPHHQPGVRKTHAAGVSGHLHHKPITHTGRATVKGWPHYRHGINTHHVPGVTGHPHHHKNIHKAVAVPGQPGRVYRYPQNWYYQGGRQPVYYNGSVPVRNYTGGVAAQPPAQQPATVWRSNRSVQNIPPGCPPQSYGPVQTNQNIHVPASQPHVCHTCGSGTKGCTTLSRFAFNSSALKGDHLNKIRVLAARILNENLNAVVVTGHTDSSGTEDYNEALGGKRASAVISQLKKQIKMLKPDAYRNIFWRTDSKGESQPLAQNDAAANRRVEICLRRINIIA